MTLSEFSKNAIEYTKANPFTAACAAVVASYLLYRKPVLFFVLLVLGLAIIGQSEIFSALSDVMAR